MIELFLNLHPIIQWLLVINLVTFFLFGFDKFIAVQGLRWRRTPEKLFFQLVLVGGGLGALLAMYAFRHKTRKLPFQIVIALILLVQLGLLAFFAGGDWFSTA